MNNACLQARRTELCNNLLKRGKFLSRQLLVSIGTVKMRIDPTNCKVLHLTLKGDHTLRLRGQKAVTSHACVNLDMHLRNIRALTREGVNLLRDFP